jgi:cyclic peptide transporter
MYLNTARSARSFMEENRNIQNQYFSFITDMISGYKELKLNDKKCYEFKEDILSSNRIYRDTNITSINKFNNVSIAGEFLFSSILGIVLFIFPQIFHEVKSLILVNYVFILLYIAGPVRSLLGSIPELIQIKISLKRMDNIINEICAIESNEIDSNIESIENTGLSLRTKKVKYIYNNSSGEFTLGPIDVEFKSEEITFITGGNGSGKSTLVKILSGLYEAAEGHIEMNGVKIEPQTLRKYYSAIFADFHLFKKMYGVDYESNKEQILKYLKIFKLDNKLKIDNGVFSNMKLSTGQRKRLALIVNFFEQRPICVFDEWAAEQDQEFREFFYTKFLPDLRASGKCIIVVTHDEKYVGYADKIIKLDMGQLDIKNENLCLKN